MTAVPCTISTCKDQVLCVVEDLKIQAKQACLTKSQYYIASKQERDLNTIRTFTIRNIRKLVKIVSDWVQELSVLRKDRIQTRL